MIEGIGFWSVKSILRRGFAGLFLMTLVTQIGAGPLFDLPASDISRNAVANFLLNLRPWAAFTMVHALPWALLATIVIELCFAVLGLRRFIPVVVAAACGAVGGYYLTSSLGAVRPPAVIGCAVVGAVAGLAYWWWAQRFKDWLLSQRQPDSTA